MTDLHALRERIRLAEGASQELDARVIAAVLAPEGSLVQQSPFNGRWCIYHGTDRAGKPRLWQPSGKLRRIDGQSVTASIDAALALVEAKLRRAHPLMTIKLDGRLSGAHGDYWFAEITWPSHERQGRGRTPALSLLVALLSALTDTTGGTDG